MKDGWMLQGGIETGITLTQDGKEIHFGKKVHTTKGVLFVAKVLRQSTPGTRLGLVSVLTKPKCGNQKGQSGVKQPSKDRAGKTMMLVKRTLHVNTAH